MVLFDVQIKYITHGLILILPTSKTDTDNMYFVILLVEDITQTTIQVKENNQKEFQLMSLHLEGFFLC